MKWTSLSLSATLLLAGAQSASAETPRPNAERTTAASRTYVGDEQSTRGGRTSSFVGDLVDTDLQYPPGGTSSAQAGTSDWYLGTESPGAPAPRRRPSGAAMNVGCDSVGGRSPSSIFSRLIRGDACDSWTTAEALLWFPRDRDAPPLVTVNPANNGGTTLLSPGARVAFGSDPFNGDDDRPIDTGLAPGLRFDAGRYLNSARTIGVGARIYGIDSQTEQFSLESDGTAGSPAIGLPFNDLNFSGPPILSENAVIVAGTAGANVFAGSVNVESELEWIGSELYGRLLLTESGDNRIDFLGGYTFNSLEDSLRIRSTRTRVAPAPPTPAVNISDSFQTQNRFHAGHMGVQSHLSKGRFTLSSTFKVHLGNMNQQVRIRGNTSGGADLPEGVLARRTNIGTHERDVFTFAPEMNLKLGMKVRRGLSATVGYSFMYWDNVLLAGDQIDRRAWTYSVNPPAGFPYPNFEFNDAGFWLQGIDLGLTYQY